jgi:hypothetical protein
MSSSCKFEISFYAIKPSFATVFALCCFALSLSNSTAMKIVNTEAATTAVTMAFMMLIGSNLFPRSG